MSSGLPENKIERELFVNSQVSSLIMKELPFNKCHQDSVPIKSQKPVRKGQILSLIVEEPIQ
jgi:hypothetical protein